MFCKSLLFIISPLRICRTAIAHDIREQVQVFLKSLAMTGHVFGSGAVMDVDLRQDLLPSVSDVVQRDERSSIAFTPYLNTVTEADLERLEYEREKDKKKKRGTRGRRVVALPDREPIHTHRSRISHGRDEHGQPLTLAAAPRIPLALTAPPLRPETGRRAAAMAAKQHISSLAAEMASSDLAERRALPKGTSPMIQVTPVPRSRTLFMKEGSTVVVETGSDNSKCSSCGKNYAVNGEKLCQECSKSSWNVSKREGSLI